jgi:hypothetical protein
VAAIEGFCLIHYINVAIIYLCWPLCLIEFCLIRRRQWWPKRRPLSLAAANKVRTSQKADSVVKNIKLAHYLF